MAFILGPSQGYRSYRVRFKNSDGRLIVISTGTEDKTQAEIIASHVSAIVQYDIAEQPVDEKTWEWAERSPLREKLHSLGLLRRGHANIWIDDRKLILAMSIGGNVRECVDALGMHAQMHLDTPFYGWISRSIKSSGYVDGRDFVHSQPIHRDDVDVTRIRVGTVFMTLPCAISLVSKVSHVKVFREMLMYLMAEERRLRVATPEAIASRKFFSSIASHEYQKAINGNQPKLAAEIQAHARNLGLL